MSANKEAIHHVLQSYVKSKVEDGDDSAVDTLRMLQSEAKLLYEREVILNNLDTDVFGIFKDEDGCADGLSPLQSKIKESISVISYDKCITREGYISIEAVIQLRCAETLTLSFSFEKQHVTYCSGSRSKKGIAYSSLCSSDGNSFEHLLKKRKTEESCKIGTQICYNIYMGKDYDKKEKLLSVEIKASGKDPSIEEHIAACEEEEEGEELDVDEETDFRFLFGGDEKDRFVVRLDPEQLMHFLEWSELKFHDFFPDCVHFLLTFPYFDNEWDIVGYVEDVVMGDDGDESFEEDNGGSFKTCEHRESDSSNESTLYTE